MNSHTQTQVMPTRAKDYLYDTNYTVSGPTDHYKAMSYSTDRKALVIPNYTNMFSALHHYPASSHIIKQLPLQTDLGRDRRIVVLDAAVTGTNRSKYFKRPIMPYKQSLGGQVVFAKRPVQLLQVNERPPSPTHRTVAIQTTYRESDTQTDPYSPEYIFQQNAEPPELLALATLAYGMGLPAGVAELEMIERARKKRIWEQSLPSIDNPDDFQKRLQMMEEMELKEWQEREIEIQKLQEERIAILETVIEKREVENQVSNDERISRIWQRKMQEREAAFEKINRKRIKAMRMLADRRSRVEVKPKTRDIIAEYGNYASRVYAPKALEGVFLDKASTSVQLAVHDTNSFEVLLELEESLSQAFIQPSVSLPAPQKIKSLAARREAHLIQQLELMSAKINEKKNHEEKKEETTDYTVKIEKPPSRPTTPTITIPTNIVEEAKVAAILLQKIIRGRCVQIKMYEGKERRKELINELRNRHLLRNTPATSFKIEKEDSAITQFELEIAAPYIGNKLDFLAKEIIRLREERRIAMMVKLAERTRRMREAEQSGKRMAELARRKEEDIVFRQVMSVNQESVDSWLEDAIVQAVDSTCSLQAREEALQYASKLDEVRQKWENTSEESVADLVSSFLIPYVEREVVRGQASKMQEKYLKAAHDAIYSSIVPHEPQNPETTNIEKIDESALPQLPEKSITHQ